MQTKKKMSRSVVLNGIPPYKGTKTVFHERRDVGTTDDDDNNNNGFQGMSNENFAQHVKQEMEKIEEFRKENLRIIAAASGSATLKDLFMVLNQLEMLIAQHNQKLYGLGEAIGRAETDFAQAESELQQKIAALTQVDRELQQKTDALSQIDTELRQKTDALNQVDTAAEPVSPSVSTSAAANARTDRARYHDFFDYSPRPPPFPFPTHEKKNNLKMYFL